MRVKMRNCSFLWQKVRVSEAEEGFRGKKKVVRSICGGVRKLTITTHCVHLEKLAERREL